MYTINFQITIFQCSKNYGSLTWLTRLKIAPNMADSTSMKHPLSSVDCFRRFYNLRIVGNSNPNISIRNIFLRKQCSVAQHGFELNAKRKSLPYPISALLNQRAFLFPLFELNNITRTTKEPEMLTYLVYIYKT